ncbi:hypothetical protein PsorP6_014872 [Peronosclerospora sorghi]|uniref:Uncharacterized protein n=1 Tax=Peronosclerospora sorghi TaxID=230839 RepID=A0ACC0VRZ2_9STRA|nr:hypothetical protein PsorP6_014872 [Peronosclerospora sorghi]
MKALLAFCKTSDVFEITFYFSTGGSPVLFAAESTSLAKFAIELTLSTVMTFLPASSQDCGEEEVKLNTDGNNVPTRQTMSQSQSSSQENPRYLTHSKRPRVD